MASPTVYGITEGAGASSTTHSITFTQTTGDLVVIFLNFDVTARTLSTVGDSFTDLTATSARFHILTKVLDGSEGGSMDVTIAVASKSAWLAYNIQGHASATAPVFSTVATGTSTAPDSATLSPSGGSADYLWISAFSQAGEEADDDTWCSAAPSTPGTFTGLVQKTTGTTGAVTINGSVAAAQYAATAATVDPGAFTVAQSLAWRAYTVAVYPQTQQNLQKTTADSLASVAEAAVRVSAKARTGADSLASVSESPVRLKGSPRTIGDALSTLTEIPTRMSVILRAVADSPPTLSDAVTGGKIVVRGAADALTYVYDYFFIGTGQFFATAADALSAVADATTRAFAGARSIPDALPSLSEAVARAAGRVRTAADALASIVESVAGGKILLRATSDALATLSEAPTRLIGAVRASADALSTVAESAARRFTGYRAVGDALSTINDAVQGGKILFRTTADAISSLAEAAVRPTMAVVRAVGDSLPTLAETTARIKAAARTVADSLSAISEAAIRATGKARTAVDALATLAESTARRVGANRAAADALASVTEAIARVNAALRSTADSLPSLSETPVRIRAALRSTADALSSVAETAARRVGRVRVVGDAVGSIAESVARGTLALGRAATDAISSVVDAIVAAVTSASQKTIFMDAQPGPTAAIGDTMQEGDGATIPEGDTMAADGEPRLVER